MIEFLNLNNLLNLLKCLIIKTMSKPLSHFEMCTSPKYHNLHVGKGLQDPIEMVSSSRFVDNGVIKRKTDVYVFDPVANFHNVKASDFALENIIEVGALDSLKESRMSLGNTADIADSIEGSVDSIIAAVDAAEIKSTLDNVKSEKSE